MSGGGVHAIIVAYPLQGHIIPAVHLALKLASSGFTITFVNTDHIHHHQQRADAFDGAGDPFASARLSGLDIRYLTVSDGLPVTVDRSFHHDLFMSSLLNDLPALALDAFRRLLLSDVSPPPTILIADTFFVWPSSVAAELRLTHVSFWTEPALVFSLYHHLHLLRLNGHYPLPPAADADAAVVVDYVPGVPPLFRSDLMSYIQDPDTTSVVHRIIHAAFDQARLADFVLCNTVEELEQPTILALAGEKPFYAVGPVFAAASAAPVPTSLWVESTACMRWLDAQPPGSVLYVSFGSYAHLSRRDLGEVAMGVAAAGVRFLWAMRPDMVAEVGAEAALPEEFAEATRGRGIVVQWCKQVEVLRSAAVGGFFTHCGWNSILESVWAGVPMVCLPLLTDQFTNRRLVVGEWRVGVGVGSGVEGGVRREAVRRGVTEVMEGGWEMRRRVLEVKATMEAAVGEGGSSDRNFQRFVTDLMDHVRGRRS